MKILAVAPLLLAAACQNAVAAEPPKASKDAPAAPAPAASSQPASTVGASSQPASASGARGTTPADRDAADADGVVRRGAALSKDAPIPVAAAYEKAAALDGKPVKVAGKVESVCAKKGCWFVVQGDKPEQKIRITAKDYGFFVPKAAQGRSVVVEGVLAVKTLDQATAQHYEEERAMGTGEKPKKITGDVKELSIVASALEMKPL